MLTAAIVFACIATFFAVFGEKDDYAYYATLLSIPAVLYVIAWIVMS